MLTIIADPAGITGRQRHGWDITATITENVMRHMPGGGADCEVWLNGRHIDPRHDPAMHQPPRPSDMVLVARRPEGFDPITWAIIAFVAAVTVSYALMPKVPGVQGVGKDSPNNRLTQQSNVARAYQAIPDVYGLRRVWPDLIQPSTVEYIDHIKYVTEWLCVSRGRGTITAVQYADTPIDDVAGASYEVFEPVGASPYAERNTTTIRDVLETFESPDVNGQELAYIGTLDADGTFEAASGDNGFTLAMADGSDLAWIKSEAGTGSATVQFTFTGGTFNQVCTIDSVTDAGDTLLVSFTRASGTWATTYTEEVTATLTPTSTDLVSAGPFTLPIDCDRIHWNVVFLRGLKTSGGSVDIKAEWWQIDSDGVEVSGSREEQTYSYKGRTYDQQFFTERVAPLFGWGRYRVQFTRLTPPIGDQGTDVAKLEELYAVRHYPTKTLPGVTVVRVTTKATQEATGYSERKFNLRWARHVRTLDSDACAHSRNFARAMAHVWTLAGNDISGLDVSALAAINAEFGENSELLRFDASLDDADMSLGERLQLIADTARCVVWRDGQRWTVTRDQAKLYHEMQLDYRNLASDGDSAISYAAHLPATHDAVEIEYTDPTTQASKAYVRLTIASGTAVAGVGANPKKIRLAGCATLAQAENRAHLEARRLLYQRISVSDDALSDAMTLGLGSLVRWVDPNDFAGDDGLQAGEVMAIDGTQIGTSEPLQWGDATEGRIQFTAMDGTRLGAPMPCTRGPGGAPVLASVPAGLYVADAEHQCGSRYAFAVGLTEAEMESAGLYTVTNIKPKGDGTVSLALATYDSRIYEAD